MVITDLAVNPSDTDIIKVRVSGQRGIFGGRCSCFDRQFFAPELRYKYMLKVALLSPAISIILCRLSSGMSRSCKVSKVRSIRPLPCGELAKMISIPNSSQARYIWDKLQRLGPPKIPARSTYNVLNTPYFSITERITFRQPAVVSDGKNSAWISLLASSIIAIRQDLLLPNQRCVLPSICSINPGASIRSLCL